MSMNSKKVKKVLFICVENACRSQLAEAISNHFFPHQLKAFSAGSSPGKEINPKAIRSLKKMGVVHEGKTKSISQAEGKEYDYIVGMGCGDASQPFLEHKFWNGVSQTLNFLNQNNSIK